MYWRALISPDKTWCFIVAGNFDKPVVAAIPARSPTNSHQATGKLSQPLQPRNLGALPVSYDASVTANIYDATGRQIRVLDLGHLPAGNYYIEVGKAIHWDDKSNSGEFASSGSYFIQLQAGEYQETRKLVILK